METTTNTATALDTETRYHDRAVYLEIENERDGWGTVTRFDAADAKPERFAIDFSGMLDA